MKHKQKQTDDGNTDSLLPIYPTLISNYRVLIYNGNIDACVPYIGDEAWTSGLGFAVDKSWHQWLLDDQVAGYATTYKNNNFTFITVRIFVYLFFLLLPSFPG